MPRTKLITIVGSVLFTVALALASTSSVFKELYPSSADQIRRIQKNVAIVRTDLASASAGDLAGAMKTLKAELEVELPKQFKLLTDFLGEEVSGTKLSIDKLSEREIQELTATLAVFLGPMETVEVSDSTFLDAISKAGSAALSDGAKLVLAVASEAGHKPVEEARARLILAFARFDTLTSYFVILSEKSA